MDCEERVLKLKERMDGPLPTYTDKQINRKREFIVGNRSGSEEQDSGNGNNGISPILESSVRFFDENNSSIVIEKKDQLEPPGTKEKTLLTAEKGKRNTSILNFFGTDSQRVKRTSVEFRIEKKVKLPDSDHSSGSNLSNRSQLLRPKEIQKTKLTQFWDLGLDKEQLERVEHAAAAQINPTSSLSARKESKGSADDEHSKMEKVKVLQEKNNEISKVLENKKKEIITQQESFKVFQKSAEDYKKKMYSLIRKLVLENADFKRRERIAKFSQLKLDLGEVITGSVSGKHSHFKDGIEIKLAKNQIKSINDEKEALEAQKRKFKVIKKGFQDLYTLKEYEGFEIFKNIEHRAQNGVLQITSDERSEAIDMINNRLALLARDEQFAKEKYEHLQQQKCIYFAERRKLIEEQKSRYGSYNEETEELNWESALIGERYQLIGFLGRGGFSEVYEGYDLNEHKYVACKIHQVNMNWDEKTKFSYIKHALRESDTHRKLNHCNIVTQLDSIEIDNNSFCTVLEKCEGPDLSSYLKIYKSLPEKEAKIIIKQLLSGLKHMSEQSPKIIHYDLKPQNILFHKGAIKISDFGLCKTMSSEHTKIELTSIGVGTYWYLPPECFSHDKSGVPKISTKVDIWSLGVIYFEMIFGQRPFGHGMSQEQILKREIILSAVKVNFPAKPQITKETKSFIENCLQYFQEDRYDVLDAYNALK